MRCITDFTKDIEKSLKEVREIDQLSLVKLCLKSKV
jgi:hypothetical protein